MSYREVVGAKQPMLDVAEVPIRSLITEIQRLSDLLQLRLNAPTQPNREREGVAALDLPPSVKTAISLLRLYAKRRNMPGSDLFHDPAWVMFLDLFVAHHFKRKISVSSACIGSLSPNTTALRYITISCERGLIERYFSEHDRRLVFLRLSNDGLALVTSLLEVHADVSELR